ncbi:MAG: helix-turn-helix domain-containing protein [Balneolia bacterium]|nr:helix-turn-helix domain-containing protein [Balneolia bacterium]
MQVYIASREELELVIKQAVSDAISEILPELVQKATAKEYLTKDDLMKLTGWSSRTIQNLRDTQQIPFSQHGRKILYPYAGIIEFLKENHINPRKTRSRGWSRSY